jgi:hypothetical protein
VYTSCPHPTNHYAKMEKPFTYLANAFKTKIHILNHEWAITQLNAKEIGLGILSGNLRTPEWKRSKFRLEQGLDETYRFTFLIGKAVLTRSGITAKELLRVFAQADFSGFTEEKQLKAAAILKTIGK